MAVDMFIKVGDVKGESKDHKYKDHIDVLSWSWGMSQAGTSHGGGGSGAGKVNVQDISFTHYVDNASTNLAINCCTGKHYPEAKLVVRKAGDKPLEYLTISMKQVMVTSLQTGGSSGDDRLVETVSLNFASFVTEYKAQDDKGAATASVFAKYNMSTNEPK